MPPKKAEKNNVFTTMLGNLKKEAERKEAQKSQAAGTASGTASLAPKRKVCLTAGFRIKFNEDIRKVGYISRASADYVTKQHAALSGRALESTWIKNNRS